MGRIRTRGNAVAMPPFKCSQSHWDRIFAPPDVKKLVDKWMEDKLDSCPNCGIDKEYIIACPPPTIIANMADADFNVLYLCDSCKHTWRREAKPDAKRIKETAGENGDPAQAGENHGRPVGGLQKSCAQEEEKKEGRS